MNDGNKLNPTKDMAREKYLNFLDVEKDSARRTNPSGIYYSFQIEQVDVILLDVRWNRDAKNDSNPKDILGQDQWVWLEEELSKNNQSKLTIIGSGS